MNRAASSKLHVFRLVAALSVVAAHASQLGYTGAYHGVLEPLGRLGVVAFFVISGFVIAHVSQTRHEELRSYMAARFARLHSVFLPALLLTWLLDFAGRALAPELYERFPAPMAPSTFIRAPLFASFLYQHSGMVWLSDLIGVDGYRIPALNARWLSNGPLWSIAYEFWYYVVFGVAVYLRGATRVWAMALAITFSGWRILLLMPLWLVGVLLYAKRDAIARLPRRGVLLGGLVGAGLLVALSSPAGFAALHGLWRIGAALFGNNYSSPVLWDLVALGPICLIVLAVVHPLVAVPSAAREPLLRGLADGTFSIYCYHVPLLLLLRATGVYASDSALQASLAALVVVATCQALSFATERRKGPWVRFYTRLLRVPARGARDPERLRLETAA